MLTAVLGLLASWFDRKITARIQHRVGPPLLQPFTDVAKLLTKETVIPNGAIHLVFLGAPLMGLAAVVLVSTVLWVSLLWANDFGLIDGFVGDRIVVLYFLIVPALSIILGGFASRNPLASLGASREMKMMLGYEVPFVLAALVPIITSGLSLKLTNLLLFQAENGVIMGRISGFLAWMVMLVCMQAKLGLAPFDVAQAETELCGGALIEYSGPPLAMYRVMRNMLLFVLPLFVSVLFMGGVGFGPVSLTWGILKITGLILFTTLVRNLMPRLRVDQALRFCWGPAVALASFAIVLALFGW